MYGLVLPLSYFAVLVGEALVLLGAYLFLPPNAQVALGIGWAGVLSMCVMHVYSIRRRVRRFARWGALSSWLHLHIFLGLQGALFVCFHSAHLSTLKNLSGLTLLMTLVVVASGIFGRYLYAMLPRTVSGQELERDQIAAELAAFGPEITVDELPVEPEHATLLALVRHDLQMRALLRSYDRTLRSTKNEVERSLLRARRRRAQLGARLGWLRTAERSFRSWQILHKPLTFLLGGVVVLHIAGHYVYGGFGR